MRDIKHKGLKASPQVTQAQARHRRTTLLLSCLGALIGALCVVYATIVLFNTTGA